jgi:effector-binding domain-containing protein
MLTEGIEFKVIAPQHTLVAHAKVPLAQIGPSLADLFGAVFAHAGKVGAQVVGMPFARYFSVEPVVDLEAGVVVKAPARGAGRIEASTLPGGQVCVAWHIGPYERAVDTYNAMRKFMVDHGKKPATMMWEVYFSDPKLEPNPEKWRTQIFWPVA